MSPTNPSVPSESSAVKVNPGIQKGLASEDQPAWAPPESQPEPRPADPILQPSMTTTAPAQEPAEE